MTEQSRLSGAVFLSYASEDADAATRICEALRAARVEVWFDKNELRGGDAWDSQIKKHVHDCALFIPVISAHTDSRIEGYFRREWNLATRRLLDMAHDAAFLVPVVIDETREDDARVPEEFLRAQWTRLPNGETPPAFAQRVRQLLGLGSAATIQPSAKKPGPVRLRGTPLLRRFGIPLLALLLVLSGGLLWYFLGASDAPAVKQAASTTSPIAAVAREEKSIAVLPFADMSQTQDQEYFADGLSEELLNLLAKLPELRVIGRTSSFRFKGQNEDLREIGEKLNVAHILEGSVRKSGEKLRISAQLIRASDSSHLWSETYDRTLDDILVVQDDIAGEVVKALKLTLLGAKSMTRYEPVNAEAYNLVLQGRFFVERGGEKDLERAVEYFRQAVERDPGYSPALAGLSEAYARQADNGLVSVEDGYRQARAAAEKALALDPRLVDAHLAMGWIQRTQDWDWAAADASYLHALELEPGNAKGLRYSGALAGTLGRSSDAIDLANKAIERDPLRANTYSNLGFALLAVDRDPEAEAAFRKALELNPDGANLHESLARALLLQGKADAALLEIQRETDEGWRLSGLPLVFHALGQRGKSDAALTALKDKSAGDSAYQIAEAHAFRGEADLAFEWLERAYAQRDPGVAEIKTDRFMRELVGDPRYSNFLRKLKLPT